MTGDKVKIPTKFSFFCQLPSVKRLRGWLMSLALIGREDQTGGSYLPRCVRRGRKRRSKASSSSSRWNVCETAKFRRERPYRCCACRKLAEPIRVCSEREELSPPSASRLPPAFTADFDILHGNFCSCCNESAFAQRACSN